MLPIYLSPEPRLFVLALIYLFEPLDPIDPYLVKLGNMADESTYLLSLAAK